MQQRLDSLLDPPILFGHRGAKGYAPDNTMPSFELALKLGATGLESDVWVTADGVAVLDHDGVVRRGVRRRPVSSLAAADLPEHIPTVAGFLSAIPAHVEISLDLKCPEAGPAVIDILRGLPVDRSRRMWLCHSDVTVLADLREAAPEVRLVNSTRLQRLTEGPERRAAILKEREIDAINMPRDDWTGGLTTLFHRFDRLAFAWDLHLEHLLREVIRMGIDAVYGDFPDVTLAAWHHERPA